jgi:hypothetical protein
MNNLPHLTRYALRRREIESSKPHPKPKSEFWTMPELVPAIMEKLSKLPRRAA